MSEPYEFHHVKKTQVLQFPEFKRGRSFDLQRGGIMFLVPFCLKSKPTTSTRTLAGPSSSSRLCGASSTLQDRWSDWPLVITKRINILYVICTDLPLDLL